MKKKLIILFTCLTLFAVVADTYKSFFVMETELVDNNSKKEKGSEENKSVDETDKLFSWSYTAITLNSNQANYLIKHTRLLPEPYTSLPELPPDLL
ncbi:MAG: hypothetical protein ABI666_01380 [Ferruginibacter sp.]